MRLASLREPRNLPFVALAAGLLALGLALALPVTRAWLGDAVGEPLRAQADPAPGLNEGYSLPSLVFWATLGGLLAWAVFEWAFVRMGLQPDWRFFTALAPFLLFGPLFHALLVAGAFPTGSVLAYLATEPVIYLTTGALAAIALALGHLARRPVLIPLVLGVAALAPLFVLTAPHVSAATVSKAILLVGLALAAGLPLAWLYVRLRPHESFLAAAPLVFAHALDGATTWMVLRDPFDLGFEQFGERNPISERLVGLANGWPYFAIKLALPLVLLALVKTEDEDPRLRPFLLFAVFVLGFGPGTSNLLQVLFSS